MTLFQLAWCCGLRSQLETAHFLCGVCKSCLCDSEDRLQSAFKMDRSNCIKLSLQSNCVYYGNSIKE